MRPRRHDDFVEQLRRLGFKVYPPLVFVVLMDNAGDFGVQMAFRAEVEVINVTLEVLLY